MLLPGESHGQRRLVGYTVHGVATSQAWLTHTPLLMHFFVLIFVVCLRTGTLLFRWFQHILRDLQEAGGSRPSLTKHVPTSIFLPTLLLQRFLRCCAALNNPISGKNNPILGVWCKKHVYKHFFPFILNKRYFLCQISAGWNKEITTNHDPGMGGGVAVGQLYVGRLYWSAEARIKWGCGAPRSRIRTK